MPETVAEGKPERKLNKTRQFYGFVGETEYDEEFIKELERDFEDSGEHCSLRRLKVDTNNIAMSEKTKKMNNSSMYQGGADLTPPNYF